MSRLHKPILQLFLICTAGFGLALLAAFAVFAAMPHTEDEGAYLFQAQVFASGRVTAPAPPPSFAFTRPFILTIGGQRFGKYPPGYPLLLALGVACGAPWLVNAAAATLGLWATYLLGRDLFDPATGLLAAGLGVLSPMAVLLSGTLMPHTTCLACLTCFAWAFLRSRHNAVPHSGRFAWLAGAMIGLAFAIRPWTALGIGGPFVLLACRDLLGRRPSARAIYARMIVPALAIAALVPLYNWRVTGTPFADLYKLEWSFDTLGFGPTHGPAGHTVWQGMANLAAAFSLLGETLLAVPAFFALSTVWLILAAGLCLPPRSRREPLLLVPVAGLVAVYLPYWFYGGGPLGPRYYAEALPFLWLLSARGLLKGAGHPQIGHWIRPAAVALVIVGIIGFGIPRVLANRDIYGITREDQRAIQAAGIHHALVLVRADDWRDYATLSWLNGPDVAAGDIIFARDRDPETSAAVVSVFPGRRVYDYDRHRIPPLRERATDESR